MRPLTSTFVDVGTERVKIITQMRYIPSAVDFYTGKYDILMLICSLYQQASSHWRSASKRSVCYILVYREWVHEWSFKSHLAHKKFKGQLQWKKSNHQNCKRRVVYLKTSNLRNLVYHCNVCVLKCLKFVLSNEPSTNFCMMLRDRYMI